MATTHADGCRVLARVAEETGGFLRVTDIAMVAADPATRLRALLVRCGGCRFVAPAQDVLRLIRLIEATGEEYARDVSIPARGVE